MARNGANLTLTAGAVTYEGLATASSMQRLYDLMADRAPSLTPDRYLTDEPSTAPWPGTITEAMLDYGSLQTYRGKTATVTATGRYNPAAVYGVFAGSADPQTTDPHELITLVQGIAATLGTDYAWVHQITADDYTERVARGSLIGRMDDHPCMIVSERQVRSGLPDLMWGTVLGPSVADLVGDQTIATCPAHEVTQIAPRAWWIQLTADLADCRDDRTAVTTARAKAKAHLGPDIFGYEARPAGRTITEPVTSV